MGKGGSFGIRDVGGPLTKKLIYIPHLEAHDLLVPETRRVAQYSCATEHDLGVVACEHARRCPHCE